MSQKPIVTKKQIDRAVTCIKEVHDNGGVVYKLNVWGDEILGFVISRSEAETMAEFLTSHKEKERGAK